HHAYAASLSIKDTRNNDVDYQEVPYVRGLENPTEASINIIRWLVGHGYSDEDIAKVIGSNVLRVLDQVWVK
ncbi:MAG: membrane dipeptidase, partial [Eubacteriales bacterium]|nr:membrane dipeptidase [Eubacteriales bacterium]